MAIELRDSDTPPIVGEILLGYMAAPWRVVSYNPETEIAELTIGESKKSADFPRKNWESLVRV